MIESVDIAGRKIGSGYPCFIIAEAGVNHNGSLERALKLVDAAKEAGADGVKFQLFRADEQVSRVAATANYQRNRTGTKTMLEMAKSYDLPWEDHHPIVEHCHKLGIVYMASCFDKLAVDFLMSMGGSCLKVGSGEITNYPLLAHMAATGKPILLSTGMCTLEDVAGAVNHIREHGDSQIVLFQCVSNYPADPATINLRAMQTMATAFRVPVGYSDHTLGNAVAVAALALGACMIEKHFTLDKTLPGPDHAMSLEPAKLHDFIKAIRGAESALGDGIKQPHPGEVDNRMLTRRSLVSLRCIHAGEKLDDDNVTFKRPATGVDPRLWYVARGRTVAVDIPVDVPITWEMLL